MSEIIEDFSIRLKKALNIRNVKPIELSQKTGITKSKISSYMSGRFKAKQDNLFLISKTLDINPGWLMGLDIPMDNISNIQNIPLIDNITDITNIPFSYINDKKIFNYRTSSDEMMPLFDIGDIAVIQKQDNIENGKTFLLQFEDKTIIRKIINNGDDKITLQAMNPYYPIINTTKDKIKLIGKVIRAENSSAFK